VKLQLKSTVSGHWEGVYEHFDRDLFLYLLPPGAKLVRFDGSGVGDQVHIRFPLKAEWISRIVGEERESGHGFFIDVGDKLPFGIKTWKHVHHVYQANGSRSIIVDDINFSTGYVLFDLLYYPLLYMAFLPRTWQYKRYFSRLFSADRGVI